MPFVVFWHSLKFSKYYTFSELMSIHHFPLPLQGEPNNAGGKEDCTGIKPSQRWNDNDCKKTQYFVCNTISQKTRARKRAEAERKRQEREAKLEKQRRKIEDQIIAQYMKTHGNAMMGSGKGGMFGPSGVRTMGRMMGLQGMSTIRTGYNRGMMNGHMVNPRGAHQSMMMAGGQRMGGGMSGMDKFGMQNRMMRMQAKNPFARVPGMYPLKPIPKGVDGGLRCKLAVCSKCTMILLSSFFLKHFQVLLRGHTPWILLMSLA